MGKDGDLSLDHEHFGCIVNPLGRYGKLEEAKELIKEMLDPLQFLLLCLVLVGVT